ncbi:MAG: hypothetical protein JW910_01605 [Anaerolineae bacterium]|nr:hypothetical protein [Anaerolineae bacterium]
MATTFTVEIDWDHNGTWTDETARTRRIRTWSGFERPGDEVAGVGRCAITLDNSAGRFSPGSSGGPLYGDLLPRRAVRITATSGGSAWVIFRGYIERLLPDAGQYGPGEVVIEAVDGMALLARQRIGVAYAGSKAVDEAISAVVSAAYTPPASSYGDNGDTLAHYGRTWQPEITTARDALRDICRAVYGRFFIARDGTATFWTRGDIQNPSVAAALTISDAALDELAVSLDVNRVVNLAQVTVYPVETLGAAQVLWQAQTVLRIAPGETRELYALFRDDAGNRCGAVNVVTPVAGTDYTVNDQRDGSGHDYTNDPVFSLSVDIEATRAKFTLGNTAIGPLYVTLLQVRGQPVVVYDPVTLEASDSGSQVAYEIRAQALDLPMQPDEVFGQALAEYVVGRFSAPVLSADRLCVRDRDTLNSVNLFSLDLLDKVVISDTHTGLSALAHWVRAVEYDLGGAGFTVTLHLERADDRTYWLLGTEDYGELDTATRLGL